MTVPGSVVTFFLLEKTKKKMALPEDCPQASGEPQPSTLLREQVDVPLSGGQRPGVRDLGLC